MHHLSQVQPGFLTLAMVAAGVLPARPSSLLPSQGVTGTLTHFPPGKPLGPAIRYITTAILRCSSDLVNDLYKNYLIRAPNSPQLSSLTLNNHYLDF